MPNWTNEQQHAITVHGDLIVSAAAGAGKTAVLTERLARIVAEGTPVERLLVMTFTRAAAAEMKSRIGARLFALAEAEPDAKQAAYLRLQAAGADRAYISTIDAFCSRVLSRHGHLIGLSPNARIADDTELALLSERAADDTITALAIEKDAHLPMLLAAFGSENAMLAAIMSAARFLESEPDAEGFLCAASDKAHDAAETDALLIESVQAAQEEIRTYAAALRMARVHSDDPRVLAVLDDDLAKAGALLLLDDYDAYRRALCAISHETLRFARGTVDADKDLIKLPRDAMKEKIRAQQTLFLHSSKEVHALSEKAAGVLDALFFLTRRYRDAFAARKREAGIIDFPDMTHMTLAVLSIPGVQAEYREKFCHIAVDEYQDCNRLQEAIVQKIKRADNLFLVGDIKQSIYRFRNAEPGLFLEKLKRSQTGAITRIDLSANFRSSSALIDAVNRTFTAIMSEATAGLAYDARALLVAGGPDTEGSARLHVIDKALSEETDTALEDAIDAELEARLVADEIHTFMASPGLFDPKLGKMRPYRYDDFAVLLRVNTHAVEFARQLSLCSVPCYAQSSGGYFDALEVVLLLNLLAAIDNRQQDVPLLSALTSGAGGFSFAALAAMRARHPAPCMAACLEQTAQEDTEDGRRAASFLTRLDGWRQQSRLVTVEKLIALLLDETGFYEEMGSLPGGAERQANIAALLQKAHAYEKTGARSLYGFLSFMERAKKNASVGAAQTAKADVVRILSMHKSKGLEYPVVFLCQLGKRFDKRDSREALLLDAKRGAGLRFIDPDTKCRTDTLRRKRLADRVAFDALSEEMRVLYVAMTRAKNHLIMTGCLSNASPLPAARRPGAPSREEVLSAASPLAWLLLAEAAPCTVHPKHALQREVQLSQLSRTPPLLPGLVPAIEARLNWTYPFRDAGALPSRASVSRLSDPDKDVYALPEFAVPAFASSGGTSAAARGTGTHLVMQHLPPRVLHEDEVRRIAASLADAGRMTPEEADAVYARQIARFTQSRLFSRMIQSPRIERELPFSLDVPAKRVFAFDSDETVLLQGVIDCCFIEDGEWVVLDYKTDRIPPDETIESVALRHAGQIRLYAEALERLTQSNVKQRYVCLLQAGAEVEIPGKA